MSEENSKTDKWTFIMTAIVPAALAVVFWVAILYEFVGKNLIHVQ